VPETTTGVCRVCGCCAADCRLCVERTGAPCLWTDRSATLCTACAPLLEADLGEVPRSGLGALGLYRLKEAGVATVGHAFGPDGGFAVGAAGVLTLKQWQRLRRAVDAWLSDRLRRDAEGNELMLEGWDEL
jgi:hypothetical protein